MNYEAVIGIEAHAELATRTKLFCGCLTEFGASPNTQVCPVCLGLPGSLPVMNRVAFEMALRIALALNCRIDPVTNFDRKNYYYPDLPKNYQISQSYHNLGREGWIELPVDGGIRRIGIWNVHLEEDAGKLIHSEGPGEGHSLVDLNRAGTPLLEIVSAPDMRTVSELEAYMRALRNILLYTEVSDCKMQEGRLRFEPSVSVRLLGRTEFGARVEIKNIGSISAALKAAQYEIDRQTAALEAGEEIQQETRLWDDRLQRTASMRRKETSADYRYFPEPDLVPTAVGEEWLESLRRTMPEMPVARALRFRESFGLSAYDAGVLTDERPLADYYEECVKAGASSPKAAANWIINTVLGYLNERGKTIRDFSCPPARLAALAQLAEQGKVSVAAAREVFAEMVEHGREPAEIVAAKGLAQVSDESAIAEIVDRILAANPGPVADYRAGKKAAFNALIGPVMRETRGKANPQVVRQVLEKRLSAL